MTPTPPTGRTARALPWPDYRAVWRWHFYAGLFCIPFVLLLACTGAIYLFRPQIEAALDRPYAHLATAGARAAPSAQAAAAVDAVPGSVLKAYQLAPSPDAAAQVLVSHGAEVVRVYVHPGTAKVLKVVNEDDRLMRVLFRLHGELLIGDRGSYVVELAACWAIVMILSGLYLWWPRQGAGPAGVVWPRLRGRLFWRDLHAVVGFWVSAFALFLLLTGLPWAKNWGGYLKDVRRLTGTAVARQDWTNGRAAELRERREDDAGARAAMSSEHEGHMGAMGGMAGMSGMDMSGPDAPAAASRYDALDRLVPTVAALDLPPPVLIAPPRAKGARWTAKSDAADRPLRVDLTLDDQTGKVVRRTDFGQRHWIDQAVGVGVAAHEGQLFGWPNQLLGLLTATGLVTLSLSAVVLWLRRRPGNALGAPEPVGRPRFALGLALIVLALGVYLPLFGLSLAAVLAVERLVLRRLPPIRRWLGLQPPMLPTLKGAT
jgi:uncharacterized iron-regulated membrane protein